MGDLLFITKIPSQSHIKTLKQLRRILAMLDTAATMADAQQLWQTFKEDGFTLVGVFQDPAVLVVIRDELEDWGYESKLNLKMEPAPAAEPTKQDSPPSAPEARPAPRAVVQETALVLMANCDGNPLQAAALAIALSRTAGNSDLYEAVVLLLRTTFPWLTQMMKAQEMLVSE